MSMFSNGKPHVDPNNVPLASLVAQEEHVDVNFIKNNNFNNNDFICTPIAPPASKAEFFRLNLHC